MKQQKQGGAAAGRQLLCSHLCSPPPVLVRVKIEDGYHIDDDSDALSLCLFLLLFVCLILFCQPLVRLFIYLVVGRPSSASSHPGDPLPNANLHHSKLLPHGLHRAAQVNRFLFPLSFSRLGLQLEN